MTKTGLFILTLSFIMSVGLQIAYADQTLSEKAQETSDDVSRGVKKAANRVDETFCADGKVPCAARKAGHRLQEGTDKAVDETAAAIDKVD